MRTLVFIAMLSVVGLAACVPPDPFTFKGTIPMEGELIYSN